MTIAVAANLLLISFRGQKNMDTTYTLVANGLRPKAIAKLRQIKQFGQDQPLEILTRGDQAEANEC